MTTSSTTYKYSVELNVHAVDASGTRFTNKGDIYINICLLGTHKRTRLMPPTLPMRIDERLYFNKIFRSCHDPRDIIQRLQNEHVLIEFLQAGVSSPVLLATYETSAKDFLYPHSYERVQYMGVRRTILLSRTIDFTGLSPNLEFTVNPSIDDVTGIRKAIKNNQHTKPINSRGKSPKRSKSPAWKPSTIHPNRPSWNTSGVVSHSLTSHTISSAIKNNYAKRDTQEKLRELAIPGEVKYVVPIDKTAGRQPFVVRHVDPTLIGRQPHSHIILNEGLVVNDYSLSRPESPTSSYLLNGCGHRSRSASAVNSRNNTSPKPRVRSPSPSRRGVRICQSADFERQGRSRTPGRGSNSRSRTPDRRSHSRSPTRLYDDCCCSYNADDEFHSTKECTICRLHRLHSEQSRRAKSLEQKQFTTSSTHRLYSPDIYTQHPTRPITSATLLRDPFRYRHGQSPAGDLSDKVINTLRRNLDSYSTHPWHNFSSIHHSDDHNDDDELLERSRRLTQD